MISYFSRRKAWNCPLCHRKYVYQKGFDQYFLWRYEQVSFVFPPHMMSFVHKLRQGENLIEREEKAIQDREKKNKQINKN